MTYPERLERIDFAALGLPEIVTLGRSDFTYARAPLAKHRHPGLIEITYLARGRQLFAVEGEEYLLTGGDVLVTYPGEIHSTNGEPREKSVMYWMQVAVPKSGEYFLNFSPEESGEIFAQLLHLKQRHFRGEPILKEILEEIIDSDTEPVPPLKRIYVRNKFVEFLLKIIFCAEESEEIRRTPDIQRVLALIEQQIEEDIEVDLLAEAVGLSESRLRMKFKEQIGIPLSEFITRKKIDKSVEYLQRRQRSVTEVAFTLGFSSSQYFSTTFKRYLGKSPTEFLLGS